MGLLVLFFSISAYAAAAEQISLSRYFTTTVCDAEKQCVGPTVKDLEAANVRLSLVPFRKGGREGLDAWDRSSVVDGGIAFRSEIHLIRREQPGKDRYYLYAMLRSGNREGVVKKIRFQSLDELKQVVLQDKPVKTAKGTIRAQLVLGPALPLDVPKTSE